MSNSVDVTVTWFHGNYCTRGVKCVSACPSESSAPEIHQKLIVTYYSSDGLLINRVLNLSSYSTANIYSTNFNSNVLES